MLAYLFIFLAILQVSFGQLPTSMPTGEPTSVPTPVPTPVPTAFPTLVPTALPTPVPTALPTALPTPVPTALPTPVPTPVPTALPTPLPGDPTVAPTSFPTAALGSPTIVFGVNLGLEGVSANDINNDVAAQKAVEEATCSTMGNGATANMCVFESALDTSTRRRLSGRKLAVSCDVNIKASVPISQVTGGNNDAQDSYDVLTSSLNTAAGNGDLTQAIQTAAVEDGASSLTSATSNSVTEDGYVEYDSTRAPTSSPTLSPQSDDDNLGGGAIAGIVIGSIFAVILVYVGVRYCYFNEDVSNKKGAAPPFRRPAEHDAANML